MHPFFEVRDEASLAAAAADVARLPAIEHLTGWNLPTEWRRLDLSEPLLHPGLAAVVVSALRAKGIELSEAQLTAWASGDLRWVDGRLESAWSPEGREGAPGLDELEASLGEALARFTVSAVPIAPHDALPKEIGVDGRPRPSRLVSAMLTLGWSHMEARGGPRERTLGNLQRALHRYVAAAHGRHVPSAPPMPFEAEEPFPFEGERRPIECRWDGAWVLVGWSDDRWLRGSLDGAWEPCEAPAPDPFVFAEALERSVLSNHEGNHLLVEVLDYPVVAAPSPSRRWIWVMDKHGHGGVFDVESALLEASPPPLDDGEPSAILRRDGTVERLPSDDAIEALDEDAYESALSAREDALNDTYDHLRAWSRDHDYLPAQPAALGWTGSAFVGLYEGRTPAGSQIGFPYLAAAFDDEARRVALVDEAGVVVLSVEDDAIVADLVFAPS